MEEERLGILKMLETGQIDAEEAATLLAALKPEGLVQPETAEAASLPREDRLPSSEERWARFWIYPLMVGAGVLAVGALVSVLVYATGAARGWLVCGWLPVSLGLGVMLLAWWTRRATWLHLRISEREGTRRKIALSFPLPLALTAWVLRIVQPFVPQLKETGVDELIIALRDSAKRDEPLFIDVQNDEGGERVQIYIG
jgi:hypothetical protein